MRYHLLHTLVLLASSSFAKHHDQKSDKLDGFSAYLEAIQQLKTGLQNSIKDISKFMNNVQKDELEDVEEQGTKTKAEKFGGYIMDEEKRLKGELHVFELGVRDDRRNYRIEKRKSGGGSNVKTPQNSQNPQISKYQQNSKIPEKITFDSPPPANPTANPFEMSANTVTPEDNLYVTKFEPSFLNPDIDYNGDVLKIQARNAEHKFFNKDYEYSDYSPTDSSIDTVTPLEGVTGTAQTNTAPTNTAPTDTAPTDTAPTDTAQQLNIFSNDDLTSFGLETLNSKNLDKMSTEDISEVFARSFKSSENGVVIDENGEKPDFEEKIRGCTYKNPMWNFIQYTVRRFNAHVAIEEELNENDESFCGENQIFEDGTKCRLLCDKGMAPLVSGGGSKYRM